MSDEEPQRVVTEDEIVHEKHSRPSSQDVVQEIVQNTSKLMTSPLQKNEGRGMSYVLPSF